MAQPRMRSKRRRTNWVGGPQTVAFGETNVTGDSSFLFLSPVADELPGSTIIRTRGLFSVRLTAVTANGDGFFGAIGFGVTTTPAGVAGVGSVPTPLTEVTWDGWMYHSVHAGVTSLETTEVARGPISAIRIPIDTKAMRKFRESDLLVGVVELGTETGTAAGIFRAETRMLSKLP